MSALCDLSVILNPCNRLDHSDNAGILQSMLNVLCNLSDILHVDFSSFDSVTPESYTEPTDPPINPINNFIYFEKFTNSLNIWRYNGITWVLEISFLIPENSPAEINTTKCVMDIDLFAGPTFTDKLNQAIAYIDPGGKIDLTNQGDNEITSTVILDKEMTIIFPSAEFTFTGVGDLFDMQSNRIKLIGTGRSPKAGSLADVTRFIMNSGRYHIYSRGFGLFDFSGFDCIGIKSADDTNYSGSSPGGVLDGSGGLYFEKENPGTTSGGNNVTGLFLKDIYIESTYAHGVYIDTPILSKLTNVRTSNIRGHGFYLNGGTSTIFESCFAASGYEAGFCIQSAAYCTLVGCAAESHGIGFWLRSVQGISVFSSGGESNKNVGSSINPIRLETLANDNFTIVQINDISNDFLADFRGTTWLITGGQGISLFSPYSTNINQEYGFGSSNTSRHFKVRGNSRGITITNPRISINSGGIVNNRFDWEFDNLAGAPSDVIVYFDPADGTITPVIDAYFTATNSALNQTYILTDTDDVVFYAGTEIYIPNTIDVTASLKLGYGSGAVAPTKILKA